MQPQANVARRGEGFPVIVIHGMGVDHRSLMMLDEYYPADTERLYVDLPGHGRTPALDGLGGLPEYVDWLDAAIDGMIGPDAPFALIGNSMGGALARAIIVRKPRRVAGIALISPVIDPVMARRHVAEHTVSEPNPDLMHRLPLDQVLDFIRMGVNQSFEAWRRYQMYVLPGIRAFDREAYARLESRYWLKIDPEKAFVSFAGPTLMVCGRQDQIVGFEDQKAVLWHYPNAQYEVVDNAGHNVYVDCPERVGALLRDWSQKLPCGEKQ